MSKSKNANISDAIFCTKVLAEDEKTGEYLIDVNKMFISETLTRIKYPKRPDLLQIPSVLVALIKKNQKLKK